MKQSYKTEAENSNVDLLFMNFLRPNEVQSSYDRWIRKSTNGVLKQQPLTLDRNSKIIMSSALYFKGDWLYAFSKTAKPKKFNVPQGGTPKVDMMSIKMKKFHYGILSNDNGEWVSIPYNSTEAMLILLPNKTNKFDIDEFVAEIPTSDITDIINIISEHNHPRTSVNITMPKFKIESALGLNHPFDR